MTKISDVFEINNTYCIDCVEGLSKLYDSCIDMVITSPPYDSVRTYKEGFTFDFKALAKQLYRVCKLGAIIVWIVDDGVKKGFDDGPTKTGTMFDQMIGFREARFNFHSYMIYEKQGVPITEISSKHYYENYEYMWLLAKGKPKTINLLRDRRNTWQNKRWKAINVTTKEGKRKQLKNASQITPISEYGVRFGIWNYPVGFDHSVSDDNGYLLSAKEHPAMFPEKLVEDHLKSWSKEGDIILDPFMGSGTTGKISQQLNRNYIGFDISKEYVKIANQRNARYIPLDKYISKCDGGDSSLVSL
jgi:site-specific DNA-methyltransferase (adenine-specific)